MQLSKLLSPMKHCLICFKNIEDSELAALLLKQVVCMACFDQFEVILRKLSINEASGIALYRYNDFIKELIYRYKGSHDFVLKDIFLSYYLKELQFKYRGYTIIPIPSDEDDDRERGFNHVVEIAKCLNMPIIKALRKTRKWKQSDKNFEERKRIKEVLELNQAVELPKKILIIDDIYTSGSTIATSIKLLKNENRHICFLIIALVDVE